MENITILVDCGGQVPYDDNLIKTYAEKLPNVSAIIITSPSPHSCGALPLLKRLGYKKAVYTAKNIAKDVKLTLEDVRNNFLHDFGHFRPCSFDLSLPLSSTSN